MEGFLGLVPTSRPVTHTLSLGQANTSQGGHCLPLFRREAQSPERPHNVPLSLAEALEEAGSTRGGEGSRHVLPPAFQLEPTGYCLWAL